MKIQLIKESSGFGYSRQVCTWLSADIENINKINSFRQGEVIEVPEVVAISFHNAVDVETGIVVSKHKDLTITEEALKHRYLNLPEEKETKVEDLGTSMKTLKQNSEKLKHAESNIKKFKLNS